MPMYSLYSNRLINALRQPVATSPADCACPPPCPVCGGLECLCRPRFFPGQVLTDDDLNRLEQYVIAKNKLHNRYFHGSGVVCGLEVVCDPCSPSNVTVKTGYALSPCGEDIVVCKDTSVNICDLINRCKPQTDNCDPYGAQPSRDCKQGRQQFVLSICYNETPSRGVQPLMSQPCACDCGGSCSCHGGNGGSGNGGCSCSNKSSGASKSTKSASRTNASKYNAQCEPTLICEGYNFTATKYIPAARMEKRSDLVRYGVWGLIAAKAERFGPLLTRLMLCYFKASEIKTTFAAEKYARLESTEVELLYTQYTGALREFAETHVAHRCDIARRLACVDMPATGMISRQVPSDGLLHEANPQGVHIVNEQLIHQNWGTRFETLNALWLEIVRECFCSSLLPPCAGPESSDCIPLAVITVDVDKCQVIDICNWLERKFALTLPSLAYWTSFMDWGSMKDAVAALCCGKTSAGIWRILFDMFEETAAAHSGMTMRELGATEATQPVMMERAVAGAAGAPAGAQATGTTAGTTTSSSDALSGTPLDTYRALVGFLGAAAQPNGMVRLLSATAPPDASDVASLKESVMALQKTVADQNARIDALMKNG